MERDQQQDQLENYLFDLINNQKNFELAAQTLIEYSGFYSYEPEIEMKRQQSFPGNQAGITSIPRNINNPGPITRSIPARLPAFQNNGPIIYQQTRLNGPTIQLPRK